MILHGTLPFNFQLRYICRFFKLEEIAGIFGQRMGFEIVVLDNANGQGGSSLDHWFLVETGLALRAAFVGAIGAVFNAVTKL